MKYKKVAIGLSLIVLGGVIGSFIPVGGGSLTVIGCLIGIVLCCLIIDSGPKSTIYRWLSSSHEERYTDAEIPPHLIENRTLSAQEQHISDEMRVFKDKGGF